MALIFVVVQHCGDVATSGQRLSRMHISIRKLSAIMTMLFALIVAVSAVFSQATFEIDSYKCSICISVVEKASELGTVFNAACKEQFPAFVCDQIHIPDDKLDLIHKSARENCEFLNFCPVDESPSIDGGIDIRVSKALGSQGYDKVRISVISNHTVDSDLFTYKHQFKYRWTDKFISTGLVSVKPGEKTSFKIAGQNVDILVPTQGAGTRGVILADPCFSSQWIMCAYSRTFNMYNHSLELLNAINARDDVSYWQILGDNFYDQEGDLSESWFAGLSAESKGKMFAATPGNHDFWVNSSPKVFVPKDQLGNGFMQFYAQDTIAATAKAPFDFSVNPDKKTDSMAMNLPTASNFFFYNQVGNTAFIGYSGAHPYDSMVSHFQEACSWASANADSIDAVLLLGHWDHEGDGCDSASPVPTVYQELATLAECQPVLPKLRYFMGHKHCNIVTEANVGFMVGAQGMSDHTECGGAYGIPVVDTTGGRFRVYYFPIAQAKHINRAEVETFDNYDVILKCIQDNGVSGCYHLATLWADTPLH